MSIFVCPLTTHRLVNCSMPKIQRNDAQLLKKAELDHEPSQPLSAYTCLSVPREDGQTLGRSSRRLSWRRFRIVLGSLEPALQ